MQEIYHRNRELLLHELYSKILTEAAQFLNFRNRKVFLLESLLKQFIFSGPTLETWSLPLYLLFYVLNVECRSPNADDPVTS